MSQAPEVILTTADNAAFAAALPTDPAWASVPAVRNGRIHVLGPEVVRPGPGVVAGWSGLGLVMAAIAWEVNGSLLQRAACLAIAGIVAVALASLLGRMLRKEPA